MTRTAEAVSRSRASAPSTRAARLLRCALVLRRTLRRTLPRTLRRALGALRAAFGFALAGTFGLGSALTRALGGTVLHFRLRCAFGGPLLGAHDRCRQRQRGGGQGGNRKT